MALLSKYCLSLTAVVLLACQGQEASTEYKRQQEADSLFKLERNYFQGSSESQELLQRVIDLDSTHDDALREIAIPFLKRGMPHLWKPLYDKAVAQDPQTWVPMRGYLYLLFYRDYQKALADFSASDTLTHHLDHPQGHSVDYWRGITYLCMEQPEDAITFFDRHIAAVTEAIGEDWLELEAFLYRGIAHQQRSNHPKAMADFEKTIKLFKSSAEAHFYWAKSCIAQGEHTKASGLLDMSLADYNRKMRLHHNYVEMPYTIYISDIETLRASLTQ